MKKKKYEFMAKNVTVVILLDNLTNVVFLCGRSKHQSRDQCPARGKECGKPNHFATVCRLEPSSMGAAAATSNSGPGAGRKVTFNDARGDKKLNRLEHNHP